MQSRGARQRAGVDAQGVADLDAEGLAKAERDEQRGEHRDQRQQIVFSAFGAEHAFEELPAVQDSNPVQEHDQPDQADRADDLRLRRKGADGQADEQDSADPERKTAQIDLADEVAEADGEENCENRLGADDFTSHIEHVIDL